MLCENNINISGLFSDFRRARIIGIGHPSLHFGFVFRFFEFMFQLSRGPWTRQEMF